MRPNNNSSVIKQSQGPFGSSSKAVDNILSCENILLAVLQILKPKPGGRS